MSDERYKDIINLPHHESLTHQRMSRLARAAQFSPFAALTGYEDVIEETGRLTTGRITLAEDEKEALDKTLSDIISKATQHKVNLTVTFFKSDSRKEGGEYITITSFLKKIDETERLLVLESGENIPLDDIVSLNENS